MRTVELIDWLIDLAAEGMASGIDEGFDIDAFVDEVKVPD